MSLSPDSRLLLYRNDNTIYASPVGSIHAGEVLVASDGDKIPVNAINKKTDELFCVTLVNDDKIVCNAWQTLAYRFDKDSDELLTVPVYELTSKTMCGVSKYPIAKASPEFGLIEPDPGEDMKRVGEDMLNELWASPSENIITMSRDNRMRFLAGVIDWYGFSTRQGIKIDVLNVATAYLLKILCRSLGFETTAITLGNRFSNNYRITLSGDLRSIPYESEQVDLSDYVPPETTMSYRIKHIKSIGYHECYSIVTPGYKYALLEDFTVIPTKGWSDGSN